MPGKTSWNHSDDSRRLVDPVVRALLGMDIGAWNSVDQRGFFDLAFSGMTKARKKIRQSNDTPCENKECRP